MSAQRAVVILAGGAGTRLWPLSTDDNPKQFLRIFGGLSLLQKTFDRLAKIAPASSIFISTNERYRAKVEEQLPQVPPANVLVEPARRNTAPAIAACCAMIEARSAGATIGIFPSDHAIADEPAFLSVVDCAFRRAEDAGELVTIGIAPSEPSTGYGYLELGLGIATGLRRVTRFIEKPDRTRAEGFLAAGNYAWNGGMFVWTYKTFRDALLSAAPDLVRGAEEYARSGDAAVYEAMPSISIDYALMEKASNVSAATGEFGWSDLGSWRAVAQFSEGTPALLEHARQVYVQSSGSKPVAVVGLENVAVIESEEGLLVVDLDQAERVSEIVKKLTSR